MSRKGTVGYQAEQLRRKGQRRIERLEAVLRTEKTSSRVSNWAKQQISEIRSAMQGTRQYSKSGKRYKSKSQNYIKGQISRLDAVVKEVAPRYTVAGDSFEVTQRELNKASVKAPSIYTKAETQVFYRATQKVWQQEGVSDQNRNEAILDYYNSIRRQNGLSPLRLDEIVDYVLEANNRIKQMQELEPEELTEEQQEFYDDAGAIDNEDADSNSAGTIGQAVVNSIRDAMSDLLVTDFDALTEE